MHSLLLRDMRIPPHMCSLIISCAQTHEAYGQLLMPNTALYSSSTALGVVYITIPGEIG